MLASHLDPDTLASLRDCMEEEYVGLIETFLVDCEERIAALKRSVIGGDPEQVRQFAHSFKGSAGNMGAMPLAQLCRDVEEGARRRASTAELAMGISAIEREFAIVRILFKVERQRYAT
ncbi:Hpt domain-containing protein [Pseudomonas oryzihabitans]|uniref:HPt (Histidine-containing phosphotransfer) domain-containing protein n=1 Tax=Pseudomonas oryzihabitans TaxID=47885 RepID=A0AAJ2BRC3_9PSED|nr:Hpt domain-containing protein [Pseudomonas psychrotolerans]MDR6236121.1 HPt (histidine-containing phosphotransfer) domain-containing protein [Pseudomonas psychrotolerans]QDD88935.1 histidine kinase [Pseudomonas psychrotolerans]